MAEQHDTGRSAPVALAEGERGLESVEAGRPGRGAWARTMLLLALAVVMLGVAPLALAGSALGSLGVRAPELRGLPGLPFAAGGATSAPDLALPRQAWTATRAQVLASAGTGAVVATLEPGFPVTITGHQAWQGTSWARVIWGGPVHKAGGSGWTLDGALASYAGPTRPIGDLGALAPSLGAVAALDGANLTAALYFVGAGQLYRVGQGQLFALGTGARAALLAATLAQAEGRLHVATPTGAIPNATPNATAVGGSGLHVDPATLAAGDPASAAAAYQAVGGAAGLSAYLADLQVSGVEPGTSAWDGAQANIGGMLAFYTEVAQGQALDAGNSALFFSLLSQMGATTLAASAGTLTAGMGGALVVGVAQAQGRWTVNVSGVMTLADGSRVVVSVALRDQATQAAAQAGMASFCGRLATLLAPV